MGRKRGSTVCRIKLTDFDKEALMTVGQLLEIHQEDDPQYGNTLLALFRLVVEYAEDNPDSDFAVSVSNALKESKAKAKRPYRRGLLHTLKGMARKLGSIPRAWEDMSVDEAWDEALNMEASRLIKEARHGRRRKRV